MKPARSRAYLAFVRALACCVCGTFWLVEAHHYGPRGLSQTASDYHAIPLCQDHHTQAADSIHRLGPQRFQEHHALDIPALIAELHREAGPKLVPEQYRAVAA